MWMTNLSTYVSDIGWTDTHKSNYFYWFSVFTLFAYVVLSQITENFQELFIFLLLSPDLFTTFNPELLFALSIRDRRFNGENTWYRVQKVVI